MIYRLSIYYYRYSLSWLRWEKCHSPIPLANFGTTRTQSWSGTLPNRASRTITGIVMHWTLRTAARRDGVRHLRQAFSWLRVFSVPAGAWSPDLRQFQPVFSPLTTVNNRKPSAQYYLLLPAVSGGSSI